MFVSMVSVWNVLMRVFMFVLQDFMLVDAAVTLQNGAPA